ncbi:MAG: htrA [Planctomycetota bacterium]|nr:MAG: htrA [Planctomycetota bacterium]
MRRILVHCLIGVIAFSADVVIADDPPAVQKSAIPKPPPEEIEQWIRDLNAPEFAKREAATRQLIAAGPAAAELLVKATPASSLEATCRITTILRAWYTSGKEELIDSAEVALEQLVESKNRHMAGRAVATLEQYATTIRHERAIAQIKQLGGTIEESRSPGRLRIAGPDEMRFFMVILGRSWRGGEEGLKYLPRVSGLTQLYLLQDPPTGKIVTPGVTQDGIDQLRRVLPALTIDYRGPAFLGVKAMANVTICRIDEVPDDTPAARAKLEAGDVVIGFDDKPVTSFQDLVKLIGTKQPGDVIKLDVLRGADENEMDALERIKGLPDPEIAKGFLDKLRERLGKKIDVTQEDRRDARRVGRNTTTAKT